MRKQAEADFLKPPVPVQQDKIAVYNKYMRGTVLDTGNNHQ